MRTTLIISTFFSAVACASYSNAATLLSHWTFDGTLNDSGTAGQNGTSMGTVGFDTTDARIGSGALLLQGTGLVDVTQSNTALRNLTSGTLSMWVRADAIGVTPWLFTTDNRTTNPPSTFSVSVYQNLTITFPPQTGLPPTVYDDLLGVFPRRTNGSEYGAQSSTTTNVNDGEWHMITATFDVTNTSNKVSLYFDGQPLGLSRAINHSQVTVIHMDRATIGAGLYNDGIRATNAFTGAIDDVRIYSGALTAAEVLALYSPVPEPSSLALASLGLILLRFRRRNCRPSGDEKA